MNSMIFFLSSDRKRDPTSPIKDTRVCVYPCKHKQTFSIGPLLKESDISNGLLASAIGIECMISQGSVASNADGIIKETTYGTY
jgi:hypothetical protein